MVASAIPQAPTIMNITLRRVAGGRPAKLHLISGLQRSQAYATAAIISDERVRKAVERASKHAKVNSPINQIVIFWGDS